MIIPTVRGGSAIRSRPTPRRICVATATRSASARAIAHRRARSIAGVDRIVDGERHVAGTHHQLSLRHHVAAADDATGTIGRPASIASRNVPPLNRADRAVDAARAFGKDDQRHAARSPAAPSSSRCRPPGFFRSTSRCPVRRRCQPRNGNRAERLLGDDPQLERQRREQDRDVVDALVVRRRRRSCAPDRAARGPRP